MTIKPENQQIQQGATAPSRGFKEHIKHTPGPWNVNDERGIDGNIYIEDALGVVAIVTDEANARLIAAAPELLEALKVLTHGYSEVGNLYHDVSRKDISAAWVKARALVAKATGEGV